MADDDYDDDVQPEADNPRDLRVQLKAAKAEAKEANDLRAQVLRLTNDGVIRDAGLTLNDRQKAALQATHEGTWTPEAIKATAQDLGFLPPPAPVVDDPSLSQLDQITAASAGTDPVTPDRDADIDAKIDGATSEAELLAIYRTSGRLMAP